MRPVQALQSDSSAEWLRRLWRKFVLPSLITYGLSQHWRYSESYAAWGRGRVHPPR